MAVTVTPAFAVNVITPSVLAVSSSDGVRTILPHALDTTLLEGASVTAATETESINEIFSLLLPNPLRIKQAKVSVKGSLHSQKTIVETTYATWDKVKVRINDYDGVTRTVLAESVKEVNETFNLALYSACDEMTTTVYTFEITVDKRVEAGHYLEVEIIMTCHTESPGEVNNRLYVDGTSQLLLIGD